VQLPKRLGLTLKPQMYSLVSYPPARGSLGRRVGRAQSRVDGLDSVVKVDQLATTIDKQIDQASALAALSLARMVGMGTLEDIGKQLVALHRPIQVDWAARFGLSVTPVGATHGPLPPPASFARPGIRPSSLPAAHGQP